MLRPRLIQKLNTPPQMRNHNAPADDQRNIQTLPDFLIRTTRVHTLINVIRDAIIASQHRAGDQPQQLLRLGIQCAGLIRLPIQPKKSLRDQRTALSHAASITARTRRRSLSIISQNPCVHLRAISLKLLVASHVRR